MAVTRLSCLRTGTARLAVTGMVALLGLTGCGSTEGNVVLGAVGATVLGARSASHEIEQIYYFGVFDPQEQLPPQVYRVRVHGQASFISFMRFASGWVHASLIDSLATNVGFSDNGLTIEKADNDNLPPFKTGRKLVLFGPEGFREAPKDHRLVLVMGSDPEAFFSAMDSSLGTLSLARTTRRDESLDAKLFAALLQIKGQREEAVRILTDAETSLADTEQEPTP